MCKRQFGFLVVAVLLFAGQPLAAQTTPPPQPTIFVSALNGHTIQRVDPSGAVTTIYSDLSPASCATNGATCNFRPEGIAIGPDGKIYVCVTLNDKILRMNQDGTGVETVYQRTSETPPQGPEGPSFNGNDLFFNTRTHSGVWKIAGAASTPFGGIFSAPVNVVNATQTGSTFGEGTAFGGTFPPIITMRGLPGATSGVLASTLLLPMPAAPLSSDPNLLIVDRQNSRILIWNGINVRTLIPTNSGLCSPCLNRPIGVAVSPAGDIFVANTGLDTPTIIGNVNRFDTNGNFIETYASNFTDPQNSEISDSPSWLAFDGSGNLFVTTSQPAGGTLTGAVGSVWKVTPSKAKTNITKTANPSGLPFVGGIALASIMQHFDATHTSHIYNFGTDTVQLSFPGGVLTSFDLAYTRTVISSTDFNNELNPPTETTAAPVLSSSTSAFPPGTTCFHYTSDNPNPVKNFCTFYAATGNLAGPGGLPQQGTDYNGKYTVKIAFFSQDTILNPGMAHEHEGSSFYDESMQPFSFSPSATPGSDPAGQGQSDGFSKVAIVNIPLVQNGNFCGFEPPLNTSGRTFDVGQPIEVEFRLTTGAHCKGSAISNAIARISVSKLIGPNFVLVPNIHRPGHKNSGNLFRFDEGEYEFLLSTRGLGGAGTYMITVTSDSFTPQSVLVKLRGEDDREDDD